MSSGPPRDPAADEIDVHALLSAVLDRPPPADLADRVSSRIALSETLVEFARLIGLVSVTAASEAVGLGESAGAREGAAPREEVGVDDADR